MVSNPGFKAAMLLIGGIAVGVVMSVVIGKSWIKEEQPIEPQALRVERTSVPLEPVTSEELEALKAELVSAKELERALDDLRRVMMEQGRADHADDRIDRKMAEVEGVVDSLRSQVAVLGQSQSEMAEAIVRVMDQAAQYRAEAATRVASQGSSSESPRSQGDPAEVASPRDDTPTIPPVELLEHALLSEPSDDDWARSAEVELEDAIANTDAAGPEFVEAECRSTMCRMELRVEEGTDLEVMGLGNGWSGETPWNGEQYMEVDGTSGEVIVYLAWTAGCSSGGGSGTAVIPDGLTAQFSGSGTASAADKIRMNGSAAADLVTIEVVIGGPTTSEDLYSFAFDLVLSDPTVAEYVDGSASVGTALTTSDGQGLQALAVQQDERITVEVSKIGGGPGNGVTSPGESTVVQLVFRLLRAGSTSLTIAGSPGSDPAAIDSAGADIETVVFDSAAAALLAI